MPKKILIFVLTAMLLVLGSFNVSASTKWGKIEIKTGMIGKVQILKNTVSYTISSKKKLTVSKNLIKGNEFGVYAYDKNYGGLYKLSGNQYVKKSSAIKYVTLPAQKPTTSIPKPPVGYGTVKGDITWQYNRYIGTKPDVGADVYLIPVNFNPKTVKKSDLDTYILIGSAPKNSNLYYGKVSGFGHYEISNVPVGKYLLVVSSAKTNRNPDDPIYIKSVLAPKLGASYQMFEDFKLKFPSHTWSTIEISKGNVLDYSYDFGYTYF
ncbi:hypothetical protein [Priestia koreensis]|uniref:hypothetical protein n=1 Tax=Priestia koreensis TaxID=284581 RepID=UPI0006A99766|nr:hypothetical protein [Priestia koreensis]